MPSSGKKGEAFLDLALKSMYLDTDKAMSYASKCKDIGIKLGIDSLSAMGYFRMGAIFQIQSITDSAVAYYSKAMAFAHNSQSQTVILGVHVNLGTMYMDLGNYDQSEAEFSEAKAMVTDDMPNKYMRVISNNLGTLYLRTKRFELAKESYLENSQYLDPNNKRQVALNYNNLGDAVKHTDGYEEAIINYQMGYEAVQGTHHYEQLTNSFENLAEAYMQLKDFGKAKTMLDSMDRYASLQTDPMEFANTWKVKSRYYEHLGDYKSSLIEYRRFADFSDSTRSASENAKLAQLQTEMDVARRDAEIALLETQNTLESERREKANSRSTLLAIFIGLLLVVLIVLAVVLRGRSRTNQLLKENNRTIREKKDLLENQKVVLERQKVVLEELNREKDGLIGIVAHDLKSPLNKSLALVSLIKTAGPLNLAQAKAAEMITQTNGIGINLIRDLLELNSIEQEKAEKTLKQLEASALFKEIGESFSAEAERKGIELAFTSPPEGVAFESHPLSICRILENLISNALKFSKKGTAVTVSATKSTSRVRLQVRDEGPGISQEDQKKLFGKFQRLTAQPTGGESSTGLGLAITKSLVEELGGEIKVDSELEKGTSFVVYLPLSAG